MAKRSDVIKAFLDKHAKPHMAELYTSDMEVQVNFAQDDGDLEFRDFNGKKVKDYSDGTTKWPAVFRIPRNAMSEPVNNDAEVKFDFEAHVKAIGLTGWDWKNKISRWVGFDFDSIVDHEKAGLETSQLAAIVASLEKIPWVSIRKSTGGSGLHVYVFLPTIKTETHTEHAALARAILGKLSLLANHPMASEVDVCGSILWIWHRKGDKPLSFKVLTPGAVIPHSEIPPNWRDHVKVVKGTTRRSMPSFIPQDKIDPLQALVGQHPRIPLDKDHKRLIDYLNENKCVWWWENDTYMLVTHTKHLAAAHKACSFKGLFETSSQGTTDYNCFMFPLRGGAWAVRRYSPGVSEHPVWDQDGSGWTRAFFNKKLSLEAAVRVFKGLEHPKGGYYFDNTDMALAAFTALDMPFELPGEISGREARITVNRKGKISLQVDKYNTDRNAPKGWISEKSHYIKVVGEVQKEKEDDIVESCDDTIRHIYSSDGNDLGWVVRLDGEWRNEPLQHVRILLSGDGRKPEEVQKLLSQCIGRGWKIVNEPFQPEYVGDRKWNKDPARLRFQPDNTRENLNYPNWNKILEHCGKNLDDAVKEDVWCRSNDIVTGAEYLKCWIACLFQKPNKPLPYLFMFGPQDCGKSIFHEALELLLAKGYMRAERTLTQKDAFNGELEGQVVCVVEEVDLNKNRQAYNTIKDWVTGLHIVIRALWRQPFMMPNTTHWIQCANDPGYCPIFPGDTRIVVIEVDSLKPTELIPKGELMELLKDEAVDFVTAVMNMELPVTQSRLSLPVVKTQAKEVVSSYNKNPVLEFIETHCTPFDGAEIAFAEFYNRFIASIEQSERTKWTRNSVSRSLPIDFPSGGLAKYQNASYIGNLAWKDKALLIPVRKPKYILINNKLVHGEAK